MTTETIFSIDGAIWTPQRAAGGFNGPGMHGGAVGAMMTGACELRAKELDQDPSNPLQPLTVSLFLLRPVPRKATEVRVETLRQGGRGRFLRAEAWTDGKLQATAQTAFARGIATPGMPEPDFKPVAPETGKPGLLTGPGHPWLGDVTEMRMTAERICWYRYDRPLFPNETPMALATSVADWSSGTWRPDGWREPKAKWFPNVELGVRLARPPRGPWVGFRNRQHWTQDGLGTTETELFDTDGPIGAASQCMVLTPMDGPKDTAIGSKTEPA